MAPCNALMGFTPDEAQLWPSSFPFSRETRMGETKRRIAKKYTDKPNLWTAECDLCSHGTLTYGTRASVMQEFRRDGWRIVNGKWRCPRNHARQSAPKQRSKKRSPSR